MRRGGRMRDDCKERGVRSRGGESSSSHQPMQRAAYSVQRALADAGGQGPRGLPVSRRRGSRSQYWRRRTPMRESLSGT